jgi:hypothetical protein
MYAMAVRMLPASEIERLTYVPALNDILLTPSSPGPSQNVFLPLHFALS